MVEEKSKSALLEEIEALQNRLVEAEGTLRAIYHGEVDALVISKSETRHTMLLSGADISYRVMVESMNEGAVTLLPDGAVFYCNPRFEEMIQLCLDDLIGTPFQSVVAEEQQTTFAHLLDQSRQREIRRELNLRTADGSHLPVQLSMRPLVTEDSTAISMVVTDLSDQKRGAQALNRFRQRTEAILTSISDGFFVLDSDLSVTYYNPAAERLLGRPAEDVIGKPLFEAFPEAKGSIFEEMYTKAFQEKLPVQFTTYFGVEPFTGWYDVRVYPFEGGISVYFQITTEHRQALEKIAFQASMLDQVANAVIATDMEGEIIYWNKFAESFFQWTAEEVLGRSIVDVTIPPEDRENAGVIVDTLLRNGHWDGEYQTLCKDGTRKQVHAINTLILDGEGNPSAIVGIAIDLSERIKAEEEIRARNYELSVLYQLSRALAQANDLDTILEIVTRQSVQGMRLTFARLAVLEADQIIIRSGYPIRELDHDLGIGDRYLSADLPICLTALRQNQPILLSTGDTACGIAERTALLLDQIQYLCLVPLTVGDPDRLSNTPLGILMLGEARDMDREAFLPQKLNLARSIGDQTASAIRRMLLKIQTEQRLKQLSALNAIDKAITSNTDLRLTLDTALNQTIRMLKVDAARVLLLDPGSEMLKIAQSSGFLGQIQRNQSLRFGESPAGEVILARKSKFLLNLAEYPQFSKTSRLAEIEGYHSYFGVPLIAQGQIKGVMELYTRRRFDPDQEWINFLTVLAEQVAIALDNATLYESLTRSNLELSQSYDKTIEGWSRAMDLRDKETEGHTQRVTEMTQKLAHAMGISNQDELVNIRWGALLHDIGKMGVPDQILLKPGPLTDEEWVLMKQHPRLAYDMLSPIHHLRSALDIPYCHHEKWDGSGYPRELQGDQIPLAARIFAVIDVWDALRSDRPYRPAWSDEKALAYILSQKGKHFDPRVVEAFQQNKHEICP